MSTNYEITNIIPFVTNTEHHQNVLTRLSYTYCAKKDTTSVYATREVVFNISPEIENFKNFEDFTQEEIHDIIKEHVLEIKLKDYLQTEFERILSEPQQASFSFQLSTEPSTETVLDRAPEYILSDDEKECITIFNELKKVCTNPIDSTFVMSIHLQMKKSGKSLEEITNFILENKHNIPAPGVYLSLSRGDSEENYIGAVDSDEVPADVLLVNPDPNATNYYNPE